MKVILFYSSIGQGHISAAHSIEKEIMKQDPTAIVLKKDIREFMDPIGRMLDEKLYWFVVKNSPTLFDNLFQSMQEQGNRVETLTCLPSDYSEKKVYEYLADEAPDAVLATHYGSAQVLGNLREKRLVPDIKIGWLHTDYFVGYFPRISKRIDRTFLAHPALETSWLKDGVFPDLIETSGIPVDIPLFNSDASKKYLEKIDFSTDVKTITLASGKEGIGDFSGIVASVAKSTDKPLQIITVCGCNKKQFQTLQEMKPQLPKHIKLEILGFIPRIDLVSFIQASDLFITKAGGLSPTEAFSLGKPTILLNVISGHERKNAELFAKLGLAEINTEVAKIGVQVQTLLNDGEKQTAMLAAQQDFRDNMNINKIVSFLLNPQIKARCSSLEFGVEYGYSAGNAHSALARLDSDAPADMEILLSYSSSKEDERIAMENPFGHIAIRIGDTVYSSNNKADPEKESPLLQHMSLIDYLFGVRPPSDNQEHTSTYGMAYGRDTLGLRIKGVAAESIQCMHEEAVKIEEEFRLGKCRYDAKESNCADFVARILNKSGYNIKSMWGLGAIYTMPLDVFESARAAFEDIPEIYTELVAYRRLPGSQSAYRFSRFPLSLSQPIRTLVRVIDNTAIDNLETMVSKQLTGYIGDDRVYYENLSAGLTVAAFYDLGRSRRPLIKLERILAAEAQRLFKERKNLRVDDYKAKLEQHLGREISCSLDMCYEKARISTEHVERIVGAPNKRLREAFINLSKEYAELNKWKQESTKLKNFMKKLSELSRIIEQGSESQVQQDLALELKDLSKRLEKQFKVVSSIFRTFV